MNNFELLWQYKLTMFDYFITATIKQDVEMLVCNKRHPVDENTTKHICKAGSKVRIWMVSRFGDCGITDNLDNAHGYDSRVDPEILENIEIHKIAAMNKDHGTSYNSGRMELRICRRLQHPYRRRCTQYRGNQFIGAAKEDK